MEKKQIECSAQREKTTQMLGKRKREIAVAPRPTSHDTQEGNQKVRGGSSIQDQDVFRRYFEAAFEPLPGVGNGMSQVDEELEEQSSQSSGEESDWEGLSDAGGEIPEVQVVEYKAAAVHRDHDDDDPNSVERQRLQYKQFMVSFLSPHLFFGRQY